MNDSIIAIYECTHAEHDPQYHTMLFFTTLHLSCQLLSVARTDWRCNLNTHCHLSLLSRIVFVSFIANDAYAKWQTRIFALTYLIELNYVCVCKCGILLSAWQRSICTCYWWPYSSPVDISNLFITYAWCIFLCIPLMSFHSYERIALFIYFFALGCGSDDYCQTVFCFEFNFNAISHGNK